METGEIVQSMQFSEYSDQPATPIAQTTRPLMRNGELISIRESEDMIKKVKSVVFKESNTES